MEFLVSKTYTLWTPEDIEIGEASDSGHEYEDELMDLRGTVRELEECAFLSVSPVNGPESLTGREWAFTEAEVDWCTGDRVEYSVHIKNADGTPVSPRNLYRLFCLAGLVRHTSAEARQ